MKILARRLLRIAAILGGLALGIPAACYLWISLASRPYLHDDLASVPERDVALVLGTSKYLAGGRINPFYRARIDAAAALYHAGKARYFIVSGDNRAHNYNEPAQMRADLIKAGIPASHIQPDYAGLRTLDSILRAREIFGQSDYLIVSQPFHNARAVFLARHHGQSPIAYNAADPVAARHSLKTRIREIGARLKAVWDLISNTRARHYGDPIPFPPAQT
ncbi:MAG: ElyC/SanA/YdcF family protein [Cardiobacteriaceae bacterium]|nr:ElyC/SanA/YdcF family protein [Cardiobacteriaceae bacterium]